jgi:hypothetical protein
LTVLRAALAVLLIVLVLSVLWGALFRPAETFGFILMLLFSAVLQTHTLAVLILIGFLCCVALVCSADQRDQPGDLKLLTDRTKNASPRP